MKVYLSGGFVTDWQLEVMEEVPEAEFWNPAMFELRGATARSIPVEVYAPMDLHKIRECDVVFAYMEKSNPTPINVVLECGYAIGLGKTVILCNEWVYDAIRDNSLRTTQFKDDEGNYWYKPRYFDLLNYAVTFHETDFGRAKEILKALCNDHAI